MGTVGVGSSSSRGARLGTGAVARIAMALVETQPPGSSPRLRVGIDRVSIDTAALAVESGPDEVLVAASWPVDLG
ncbi:MAG TPA: hypothetical protein PKC73_06825 [Dermatophilaceae bacterium]|nr:hypothetical protein [Dermatophilaceae bacterium]HMT89332.1 hypothetical protein [Dermatophilaceae bacterium]